MTVSASDVARELRNRLGARPTKVRVHKLLFYAQAWRAALNDEPLFAEEVCAYPNGPVVHDLWTAEKRHASMPAAQPVPHGDLLDFVVSTYATYSDDELRHRTHLLPCWKSARRQAGDDLEWLGGPGDTDWRTDGLPTLPMTLEDLAHDLTQTEEYSSYMAEVDRRRASRLRWANLDDHPELVAQLEALTPT